MRRRNMKKLVPLGVCLLVALTARAADTVTLKDGRIFNGTYLGGSSRELKFESGDRIQTLDVSAISSIQFGSSQQRSAAMPAPVPAPRLLLPAGTKLVIRMID